MSPSTTGSTPIERRRWYQGDEPNWVVDAATDLRVGGRFSVRWGPTTGQAYQEEGVFEVVDPPNQVVYTSRFTPIGPTKEHLLTYASPSPANPDGDGTLLTPVESGHPTIEIRDAFLRNGADQGLGFYERTLPSRTRTWDPRRPPG